MNYVKPEYLQAPEPAEGVTFSQGALYLLHWPGMAFSGRFERRQMSLTKEGRPAGKMGERGKPQAWRLGKVSLVTFF